MSVVTLPGILSVEEAAERLKALEAVDSSNAFEMGDIVLEAVPVIEQGSNLHGSIAGLAGTGTADNLGIGERLKELAEASGVPLTTLKTRRYVSARIPVLTRVNTVPWNTYRRIAPLEELERDRLLTLVARPNPDREDGRWTETAVRAHLPKRPGTGGAPEVASDPAEQALDQACRAIDYLLMHNDIERLERFRVYWHRQVPEKLQALDWWTRKQEERQQQAEARAQRKQAAS